MKKRLNRVCTSTHIVPFRAYRVFEGLPKPFDQYIYPLRFPEDKSHEVMVALNKNSISEEKKIGGLNA